MNEEAETRMQEKKDGEEEEENRNLNYAKN